MLQGSCDVKYIIATPILSFKGLKLINIFHISGYDIWFVCLIPLQDSVKYQTRFISQKPAKVVLSSMEVVAQSMGFKTHIRNYKVGSRLVDDA